MMANMSGNWQKRVADTIDERLGLLDNPKGLKYRKTPVFTEPVGDGPKKPLTAFGITSGVGSMLIGADALGFKVVGNVEFRDYYRFRNSQNQSSLPNYFLGAFQARGIRDVPSDLLPTRIDFAAGHPECGLYSGLSHSVTKGSYRDIRGKDAGDIPLFLRLVSELQPRFFLMDDLPGSFDALPMDEYVKMLPNYDLFPEWVSNWGYGNIQKHRNRMFIVGALKSENFVFRPGEALHNLVLSDVLEGLPGFGQIANHAPVDPNYTPGRYVNMNAYGHRPTWRELEVLLAGATHAQVKYYSPEGVQKSRPGTISPKIDGFCPVLSGQFNPIHPERVSPLTIRERARIQGFPDSFVFYHDEEGPFRKVWEPYNSDGQRGIKQTGKAMPIQFCTFVAAQVKAHIDGEDFEATDTRVIKANPKVDQAKKEYCKLSGYAQQAKACSMCWQKETCEVRSSRMV